VLNLATPSKKAWAVVVHCAGAGNPTIGFSLHLVLELCIVRQVILMKQEIRQTVVVLLLMFYVLLGAIGHLESLTMIGFGTHPHNLVQAKAGPAKTSIVYWTQHKHIPSTVKVEVPSPAIVIEPEVHHIQTYYVLYSFGPVATYLNPFVSFQPSRAPPHV
jgi:hypothetical protein